MDEGWMIDIQYIYIYIYIFYRVYRIFVILINDP